VHLWAGQEFCRRVLKAGFGLAGGVFTFNSAGLEVLQRAKQTGLKAVTEQTIAPMSLELELLSDEAGRFPGWEVAIESGDASAYCEREIEEWKFADLILCGSEFVRDGVGQCGGPREKCVVVPYGVDLTSTTAQSGRQRAERPSSSPLHVLTVGSVGLRKGSPYVLEAARRLKGKAQFRMVGSIEIRKEAQIELREHLELIGAVPRNELTRHFAWADVFLLPSLCEGSATVTYEALAYGLPVICTANTGSVVRDGVEGFVIPIRDAAAIVDRLRQLFADSELLARMSANSATRANEFTVAAYADRLARALRM
jgi:glycosyltransferase involved in cell wall biosynthesis